MATSRWLALGGGAEFIDIHVRQEAEGTALDAPSMKPTPTGDLEDTTEGYGKNIHTKLEREMEGKPRAVD